MIFTFKDILTPDEILRLRFLNKKILDRIYYFDYVKMINDDRVFARSLFLECDKKYNYYRSRGKLESRR